MLTVDNIQQFLQEHDVQKLTIGMSGADLYKIDEEYILKHVSRKQLRDEKLFDLYRRESVFYQVINKQELCCIPKVVVNKSTDDEIIILMKQYQIPRRDYINDDFLYRTMQALASVHCCKIPPFLLNSKVPNLLTKEQITGCVMGWRNVLKEHPGCFDDLILDEIAEHINDLIVWHESATKVLCHGDFHMDNLLLDQKNAVIICDWQNVECGDASGDLSFFISRLDSEGIAIDKQYLVNLYVKAMFEKSGIRVDDKQILDHMYAANIITSFIFWHEYLHNSTKERVERIFTEMKDNYLKTGSAR